MAAATRAQSLSFAATARRHARECSMLDGVMLLWFVLSAVSLLFVAIDIRTTPESVVMKWGFVLLTAYTGVVGAFLYVLGCREPLPGLHERYVAARWRQTLGSTMHCVAGDGVGILAGAVLSSVFGLAGLAEVVVEYILGFAFGWTIFQALFMRDLAGGSYRRALTGTFVSELLSMNLLMAGMVPTMMTLRPVGVAAGAHDHSAQAGMGATPHAEARMPMGGGEAPRPPVPVMALLSFLALAVGVAIAFV